ncbi:2OG-Fe(II) oxygenase family protein [Cupriavidus metallidurans]|uniref:2OG-Fe(II) oxygenase family protein n=1 Tax=Cupriavidus metallidurans TaxID=119219 RepID=UPI00069079FD|nr:2OG-Fe(II) oxygenase [Cupriavidus metallidurans]
MALWLLRLKRVQDSLPGVRYFHDLDGKVSTLYRARLEDGSRRAVTYLLDPALRVLTRLDWTGDPEGHVARLKALLDGLPAPASAHAAAPQAPVLVVPRIFSPELCRALVNYYNVHGGSDSGFMRDINGQTTTIIDHDFKRRGDRMMEDPELQRACVDALRTRLMPEVYKAFQFKATYIERSLVSCYDARDGGHFQAHRDNTTLATSHRRFAVSLFLNSGEYEGGHLQFAEFGKALYSAPTGGAVVFSCSLLHEATPVTRGRRYMFLPFLYDDASRLVREANVQTCPTRSSIWPTKVPKTAWMTRPPDTPLHDGRGRPLLDVLRTAVCGRG